MTEENRAFLEALEQPETPETPSVYEEVVVLKLGRPTYIERQLAKLGIQ